MADRREWEQAAQLATSLGLEPELSAVGLLANALARVRAEGAAEERARWVYPPEPDPDDTKQAQQLLRGRTGDWSVLAIAKGLVAERQRERRRLRRAVEALRDEKLAPQPLAGSPDGLLQAGEALALDAILREVLQD